MGLESLVITKETAAEIWLTQNRRYRAELTQAEATERALRAKIKELETALRRASRRAEKAEDRLEKRRERGARCRHVVMMPDDEQLVCELKPDHPGSHRQGDEVWWNKAS